MSAARAEPGVHVPAGLTLGAEDELHLDPAARRRGLFRAAAVQGLLADPDRTRTRFGSNALWQLGLPEMWMQHHGVG